MVTSNVDSYYPLLAQQYAQGYRLLSFYRIPGQAHQRGLFSTTMTVPFQVSILSKKMFSFWIA
jgi:hypothetical protein